jgi:hypothetical protein
LENHREKVDIGIVFHNQQQKALSSQVKALIKEKEGKG